MNRGTTPGAERRSWRMGHGQGRRAVGRWLFPSLVGLVLAGVTLLPRPVTAQQLVDRVLAVVDGQAITLSDVRAAAGLGVVTGDDDAALQQMIDRQLVLLEVQRFPPPEPPPMEVDAEAARLQRQPGLAALMQATGLDAIRLRELARETLRIRLYLDQRFGTSIQVSDDEVDRYFRAHPEEFLRNGLVIPFAEAEPLARQRASAERRQAVIDQWIADLRMRATISRPLRRSSLPHAAPTATRTISRELNAA